MKRTAWVAVVATVVFVTAALADPPVGWVTIETPVTWNPESIVLSDWTPIQGQQITIGGNVSPEYLNTSSYVYWVLEVKIGHPLNPDFWLAMDWDWTVPHFGKAEWQDECRIIPELPNGLWGTYPCRLRVRAETYGGGGLTQQTAFLTSRAFSCTWDKPR